MFGDSKKNDRTSWDDFESQLAELIRRYPSLTMDHGRLREAFERVLRTVDGDNDLFAEPGRDPPLSVEIQASSTTADDLLLERSSPALEEEDEIAPWEEQQSGQEHKDENVASTTPVPVDVTECLGALQALQGARDRLFDAEIKAILAETKHYQKRKAKRSAVEALVSFLSGDLERERVWPIVERRQLVTSLVEAMGFDFYFLPTGSYPPSARYGPNVLKTFERMNDEQVPSCLPGAVVRSSPTVYDADRSKIEIRGTYALATSTNAFLHVLARFDEGRALLEAQEKEINQDLRGSFRARLAGDRVELWDRLRGMTHRELAACALDPAGALRGELQLDVLALVAEFLAFVHRCGAERGGIEAVYDRLAKQHNPAPIWPQRVAQIDQLSDDRQVDWNRLFQRFLRAMTGEYEEAPLVFQARGFTTEHGIVAVRPGCEDPDSKDEWHRESGPQLTVRWGLKGIARLLMKLVVLRAERVGKDQSSRGPAKSLYDEAATLKNYQGCVSFLEGLLELERNMVDRVGRRLIGLLKTAVLDVIEGDGGSTIPGREIVEHDDFFPMSSLVGSDFEPIELGFPNLSSWKRKAIPAGQCRILALGYKDSRGETLQRCKVEGMAEGEASATLRSLDDLQLALAGTGSRESESREQILKIMHYQLAQEAKGIKLDMAFFIRLVNRLDDLRDGFSGKGRELSDRATRDALFVLREEFNVVEKVIPQGTIASEIAHEWIDRFVDTRPSGSATPGTIIGTKRRVFLDQQKKVIQSGILERARSVGLGGAMG